MVMRTASAVPLLDHWMFLMPLARDGSYSLRDLWAQHNEHRLVIPKLFYLADFYWFRGTNTFLFISILVVQTLHALLLTRIAYVSSNLRPALFALIFAFLFSPVQLHNFVWEFQICFVLGAFLASAAAWSFGLFYADYHSSAPSAYAVRMFVLTIALTVCTTLSLANGLVLWPILTAMLLILRVNWRYVVAFVAVAAIVFAAYFHEWFTPDGHSHPLISLRHPVELIHYVLCYMGGSWANFGLITSSIMGAIGVGLGSFVLFKVWKAGLNVAPVDIFVAITVLGSIATAFETGLGRLDFGLEQATSSRYQTVALVFWAAIAIWVVSRWANRSRFSPYVAIAGLVLFVLVPFIGISRIVGAYSGWPAQFDDSAATMLSGVDDDDGMDIVWPMDGDIQPVIDLLRARHKSVFATALAQKLGTQFQDSFRVEPQVSCSGQIRIARLLDETTGKALELTGLLQTRAKIRNLVMVNAKGTVSGFGFNRSGAWQGYSRVFGNAQTVTIYGLLSGSTACSVATFE